MKFYVFLFSAFFINGILFSQEYDPYTYQDIEQESALKDKIFFGGGLGLQFGQITVIKFTPEIGYKFTEKFNAGTGLYYIYYSNGYYNYSDKIYGGKLFARYFPAPSFFISSEYEVLNVSDYSSGYYTGRTLTEGLLLGGGWYQKIGERFGIITSLMYNVLQNENTPYQNPVFRISFVY